MLRRLIYLLIGTGFGVMHHLRYYRWRDCFNELGRCYDPDGSGEVYTTAGWIWAPLAALFLLLAARPILQRLLAALARG